MILVFGGTTEGKQAIEVLNVLQKSFVYTTKTKIKADVGVYGTYRFGVLTLKGLMRFVKEKGITTIVNASHPFAEVLHETIATVAKQNSIPVYRLQREYPVREVSDRVLYVNDYTALQESLMQDYKNKKGLFLTGVQTIDRLRYFWEIPCEESLNYFRILDRPLSIDIAMKSNFPKRQLILGMPNKNIADEVELIKNLKVDFIVTKESGESGALTVKMNAAKQCGIPIIIIKKPVLPAVFILVENKESLHKVIENL